MDPHILKIWTELHTFCAELGQYTIFCIASALNTGTNLIMGRQCSFVKVSHHPSNALVLENGIVKMLTSVETLFKGI